VVRNLRKKGERKMGRMVDAVVEMKENGMISEQWFVSPIIMQQRHMILHHEVI
jgi:hypothetical protein